MHAAPHSTSNPIWLKPRTLYQSLNGFWRICVTDKATELILPLSALPPVKAQETRTVHQEAISKRSAYKRPDCNSVTFTGNRTEWAPVIPSTSNGNAEKGESVFARLDRKWFSLCKLPGISPDFAECERETLDVSIRSKMVLIGLCSTNWSRDQNRLF